MNQTVLSWSCLSLRLLQGPEVNLFEFVNAGELDGLCAGEAVGDQSVQMGELLGEAMERVGTVDVK